MTLGERLCDDGACIGVLNTDGTCAVCGLKSRSQPAGGASKVLDGAEAGVASTDYPVLVVMNGSRLGAKYLLTLPSYIIGRSSKSAIQIDEEWVSRAHAKIENTGRTMRIQCLGATNETYVNDEPIQECALKDGDLIKIGKTVLKFLGAGSFETFYHEEMWRQRASDRRFCENGTCIGTVGADGKCGICHALADPELLRFKK